MLSLGPLSFAAPWVLLAIATMPLIWLLLRITPPVTQNISFPPVRFLFDLKTKDQIAARTPPWLLILRLIIVAMIIAALAQPVWQASPVTNKGPLVVVIDDDWAAANDWNLRQKAALLILGEAELHQRPVVLALTAKNPETAAFTEPQRMTAVKAQAVVSNLVPKPWAADRSVTLTMLSALTLKRPADSVWISNGISDNLTPQFMTALQRLGTLTIIGAPIGIGPLALKPPERTTNNANALKITVVRPEILGAVSVNHAVRALDKEGHVLARKNFEIGRGQNQSTIVIDAPNELANRVAQVDIEAYASASSTYLLDNRWKRRPIGIAGGNLNQISTPFLDKTYYVRRALEPYAEVRLGTTSSLLQRELAVLFMVNDSRVQEQELDLLAPWVESGGILVRFAGVKLEDTQDSLLPVRLRGNGRTFGGTMSWSEPATIAPFSEDSPFRNLSISGDELVSTQVLAEPGPSLTSRTWARLDDGTPLVTGGRRGDGWIVLFHVTPTPDWSNLPLAGLFVDMLQRIVDLSDGVDQIDARMDKNLLPIALMNGFGVLGRPSPTVLSIPTVDFNTIEIGPSHPPGYYGSQDNRRALNLSPSLFPLRPVKNLPSGARYISFSELQHERNLGPWLLLFAFGLLVIETAASMAMRGLIRLPMQALRNYTAVFFVSSCLIAIGPSAHAQSRVNIIDDKTVQAILHTRLAYIQTGRESIDRVTEAGLTTLTRVLGARTSAELATPSPVDLELDALFPYPLIYWRVTPAQVMPSQQAITKINKYLSRGGTLLIDAPEPTGGANYVSQNSASSALRAILTGLDIPPLIKVPEDHVLRRSFYLLTTLPGRFVGQNVWIEQDVSNNDGVSSVVIGSHDWAGAWAMDTYGLPIFAAVPDGERQREAAYRFGVNLVMYALTGNYKADQVHLPAIMQRLTQ